MCMTINQSKVRYVIKLINFHERYLVDFYYIFLIALILIPSAYKETLKSNTFLIIFTINLKRKGRGEMCKDSQWPSEG